MKNLIVIKIGGNVIDDKPLLDKFLRDLCTIDGPKILVHGGGKLATELSSRLGIETKMVEGRRITDDETIRIVTMTYAGFINKTIVAKMNACGGNAIGLSGVDARLIPAAKRPVKDIDYGWVGDIQTGKINISLLTSLLSAGLTPVVAPISCTADGYLLNINADTIAQSLAVAMSGLYQTSLLYCFERKGVLSDISDPESVIPRIRISQAEELKANGTIGSGMIPKIDNACLAISDGVSQVIIGRSDDIVPIANNKHGYGTRICQ
ncbi:MAG: acetylglutamate kinase [Bacteroidetes bacterium]|nr:acetylglutamate kinase [Bacteroidota bacterium]